MTTSTSRGGSGPVTASTASRCPGRNASNPNSSCSAPTGSVARATGSGGGGPSPGRATLSTVTDTGRATIPPPPEGIGALRRFAAKSLQARERERVLERVLRLRRGRAGQRVVAREAGVAVRVPGALDRLVDARQGEIGERVAAQLLRDLGLRAAVGDHLLAGGHVDAVVAGVADGRGGDPHVDLERTRVAQHLHDLAGRVGAPARVGGPHHPLAAPPPPQRGEPPPPATP